MPDWSYRTLFRPVLFRLPAATARDFCLGFMGLLSRMPLGPAIIDLMGHMRADPRLKREAMGIAFPTAVGMGPGIDLEAQALAAWSRFGFGFLELGPVTVEPTQPAADVQLRQADEAIWFGSGGTLWHESLARRLEQRTWSLSGSTSTKRKRVSRTDETHSLALRACTTGRSTVSLPLLIRLTVHPQASPELAAEQCRTMIERLAPHAAVFTLATAEAAVAAGWSAEQWQTHLRDVRSAANAANPMRPIVLCLPANLANERFDELLAPALETGIQGVLIDGTLSQVSGGKLRGSPSFNAVLAQVTRLRRRVPPPMCIIASGGIHEPRQALEMLEAGADLVQVDSGLVYAGPGLPKRINEALLEQTCRRQQAGVVDAASSAPSSQSWFWALLIGLSMFFGGLLALIIATTRVVLHYDEAFVGMTREQLARLNPRLLDFMTHDRVTLAGTMLAVGVLYSGLAWFGIRRGWHWARVALLASSFAGFVSFFSFLGFGYFDPFHAFVAALLFQLMLLALHSPMTQVTEFPPANLHDDWRWRWSLWGQLLFVVHGAVLIVAGLVICSVGMTSVFVHEDLEFMQTTAEALAAANPRLVPLVAHDRATFGGMLLTCGVTVLLAALWGFRQSQPWLWWALSIAGTVAYACTLIVHFAVGYTHAGHLAPAWFGLALLWAGSVLSYPYLCRKD